MFFKKIFRWLRNKVVFYGLWLIPIHIGSIILLFCFLNDPMVVLGIVGIALFVLCPVLDITTYNVLRKGEGIKEDDMKPLDLFREAFHETNQ